MLTKDKLIWKAISIEKLKNILNCIPENYLIAPSPSSDLMILTPDETPEGLIEISSERYDPELFMRK